MGAFSQRPVMLVRRAALSSFSRGLNGAATATKAAIADKGMKALMDTPPPVSPLEQLPELHAMPPANAGKGLRELTSMVHSELPVSLLLLLVSFTMALIVISVSMLLSPR